MQYQHNTEEMPIEGQTKHPLQLEFPSAHVLGLWCSYFPSSLGCTFPHNCWFTPSLSWSYTSVRIFSPATSWPKDPAGASWSRKKPYCLWDLCLSPWGSVQELLAHLQEREGTDKGAPYIVDAWSWTSDFLTPSLSPSCVCCFPPTSFPSLALFLWEGSKIFFQELNRHYRRGALPTATTWEKRTRALSLNFPSIDLHCLVMLNYILTLSITHEIV